MYAIFEGSTNREDARGGVTLYLIRPPRIGMDTMRQHRLSLLTGL